MFDTIQQKVFWSTISIWYWISFPILWFNFLWFEFILYFIFILIDRNTWISAAKKKQKVYSKIEREWLEKKMQLMILLGTFIIITSWLNQTLWITSYFIWLIPHFFWWYLILAEFKSIIENYSVIFEWTKHEKFFNILNYLTKKIFNLSLEKLKEISERKIDEKFNK